MKILVLLLAFFSIGGASGYAFSISEVRDEHSPASEKLAAANPLSVAYRENLFPELPELKKDSCPAISSVRFIPHILPKNVTQAAYFSFKRDLRKDLKTQLFPKHFFW